jgi:hypothetical protein
LFLGGGGGDGNTRAAFKNGMLELLVAEFDFSNKPQLCIRSIVDTGNDIVTSMEMSSTGDSLAVLVGRRIDVYRIGNQTECSELSQRLLFSIPYNNQYNVMTMMNFNHKTPMLLASGGENALSVTSQLSRTSDPETIHCFTALLD